MKSNKPARKYQSALVSQLLAETSDVEKAQIANRMTLAARLDDLIIARGWNKSEFAAKVGKSPSEITKWLSGTQNFTIDTLTEIALAFAIPIADLFVGRASQVVYKISIVISGEKATQDISYADPVSSKKDLFANYTRGNYNKKSLLLPSFNSALS